MAMHFPNRLNFSPITVEPGRVDISDMRETELFSVMEESVHRDIARRPIRPKQKKQLAQDKLHHYWEKISQGFISGMQSGWIDQNDVSRWTRQIAPNSTPSEIIRQLDRTLRVHEYEIVQTLSEEECQSLLRHYQNRFLQEYDEGPLIYGAAEKQYMKISNSIPFNKLKVRETIGAFFEYHVQFVSSKETIITLLKLSLDPTPENFSCLYHLKDRAYALHIAKIEADRATLRAASEHRAQTARAILTKLRSDFLAAISQLDMSAFSIRCIENSIKQQFSNVDALRTLSSSKLAELEYIASLESVRRRIVLTLDFMNEVLPKNKMDETTTDRSEIMTNQSSLDSYELNSILEQYHYLRMHLKHHHIRALFWLYQRYGRETVDRLFSFRTNNDANKFSIASNAIVFLDALNIFLEIHGEDATPEKIFGDIACGDFFLSDENCHQRIFNYGRFRTVASMKESQAPNVAEFAFAAKMLKATGGLMFTIQAFIVWLLFV